MILESLCVALAELVGVLLVVVVFEYLRPNSKRLPACPHRRRPHSHKQHAIVSDNSDGQGAS